MPGSLPELRPGSAGATGRPASRHASKPPITSPARLNPRSTSVAAASTDEQPWSQMSRIRASSPPTCGLRHALSGSSRHSSTVRGTCSEPGTIRRARGRPPSGGRSGAHRPRARSERERSRRSMRAAAPSSRCSSPRRPSLPTTLLRVSGAAAEIVFDRVTKRYPGRAEPAVLRPLAHGSRGGDLLPRRALGRAARRPR